jgi:hypothetical protein
MLEFTEVTFYDKTIKAWACRGAINLYMILYSAECQAYFVLVRAYDSSELEQLPVMYKTQTRAVKAASVHAKRTA